jgi:hypothetical protein
MHVGKTLFAPLMGFMPWTNFGPIVDRYGGNASIRRMTCAVQFRVINFAQLTWRESLRDTVVTLSANATKIYAMALYHSVHSSTLADVNETYNWHIWSDVAAVLIRRVRKLYTDTDLIGLDLKNTAYALDFMPVEAGALYVMDRSYRDFARLYAKQRARIFLSCGPKST